MHRVARDKRSTVFQQAAAFPPSNEMTLQHDPRVLRSSEGQEPFFQTVNE